MRRAQRLFPSPSPWHPEDTASTQDRSEHRGCSLKAPEQSSQCPGGCAGLSGLGADGHLRGASRSPTQSSPSNVLGKKSPGDITEPPNERRGGSCRVLVLAGHPPLCVSSAASSLFKASKENRWRLGTTRNPVPPFQST